MAKRSKNQHLLLRNGYYHFAKRISGTQKEHRVSLKTRDVEKARRLRDELLQQMEEQAEKVIVAKSSLEFRKLHLEATSDEEQWGVEEMIDDEAQKRALELGVYEQVMRPPQPQDPPHEGDAKAVVEFAKSARGELHILSDWLDDWLSTVENKQTRLDYGRGVRALMKRFPVAEEIDRAKAGKLFQTIGNAENVHKSSVEKWRSGYISLWKFLELDREVWRGHDIPETKTKEAPPKKEPWTKDEVRMLYDTAVERNHWLKHPIWIAVHTGARQSAIANLKYNRDARTITFPKAKKETKDRTIPAHTDILSNLEAWVQNRKASTTISNQFTLLKKSLGYGFEKDFHSFRRTLITEFQNLECPEHICADIVAHKKLTITYGLYSGGANLDVMRHWLDKVKF